MAKRIKALGMRLGEQGYRFILNELKNHEVIWQPYQGGPDDEMTVVQEGRALCERDICLHAPQEEIPAVAGHWQACPLSEEQGEGTSGGAAFDAESIIRGEILRLSHLVENKDAEVARLRASLSAERERRRENEAIIEVLADSREGGRDQDTSEAMRIALEGELQILRAEVDRLQEEARSERDRALAERVALTAQVDELRAKLRGFATSAQSGTIVAFAPPPPSLAEEKARLHDQYARRMDRMALHHDEVVADLRSRLARCYQRATERGYALSDSFRTPYQRAPGPSSFASSAHHGGAAP